jgi:hypothetical protein
MKMGFNLVLKNNHQAVSQGERSFWKAQQIRK